MQQSNNREVQSSPRKMRSLGEEHGEAQHLGQTLEDDYSIIFSRNSTKVTRCGSVHSKEDNVEISRSLHAARGRNMPIAFR